MSFVLLGVLRHSDFFALHFFILEVWTIDVPFHCCGFFISFDLKSAHDGAGFRTFAFADIGNRGRLVFFHRILTLASFHRLAYKLLRLELALDEFKGSCSVKQYVF